MTDILQGKTLLIVDDEPDLRGPLVFNFQSLGCKTFEASGGREAIEILKREHVDAVISDIRMPNGDGVELLRAVKAIHHRFPVIMLITGYSDLPREEAFDLGAEEILAKPFDLDDIEAAVIKILTPRKERWARVPEGIAIVRRIEESYKSLSDASERGALALGSGGMFLASNHDLPARMANVGFKIQFTEGEPQLLEGVGAVRWVRPAPSESLSAGLGIEFTHLGDQAATQVLERTEHLQTKSFIPKGFRA